MPRVLVMVTEDGLLACPEEAGVCQEFAAQRCESAGTAVLILSCQPVPTRRPSPKALHAHHRSGLERGFHCSTL